MGLFKPKYRIPLQKQNAFSFLYYWWLRDTFMRMMLDVKCPASFPWYQHASLLQFVCLWQHPTVLQAMHARLTQVRRLSDYARFEYVQAAAGEIKALLEGGTFSEADVEEISAFLAEASLALASIDRWFARRYWPRSFRPVENRGEFENTSIQTALRYAPFCRKTV